MKTLYIIRGVSGSGKTTLAKQLASFQVAADDYFMDSEGNYNFKVEDLGKAHEWCRGKTCHLMSWGLDIAVHNTFTQESEMKPYFDLAKEHGYKVVSLIVENRHGGVNTHGVSEETLVKQEARLRQNIKLR